MTIEAELEQVTILKTIPNRKTITKVKTRRLFLKEVEQRVPNVLKSLYEQVYTLLCDSLFPGNDISEFSDKIEALTDQTIIKDYTDKHPNHGLSGIALEIQANRFWGSHNESLTHWYGSKSVNNSNFPELIPLYEKVKEWSINNHLDANWIRETAISTLLGWAVNEEDEPEISFHWHFPGEGRSRSINDNIETDILTSSLSPGLLRYFPLEETSKKYLDKLEKFLLKKIETDHILSLLSKRYVVSCILTKAKDYCKKVNNYYLENGCIKINPKQQLTKHLEWAVKVQVEGYTYSELTETDKSNVLRRVEEILKIIDLPIRKGIKPGRPLGKKDTSHRHIAKK